MMSIKEIFKSLRYSLYVIFHPFKGFWELKREKKRNIFSALILLMLLIITYVVKSQLTGYLYNNNNLNEINVFMEISSVFLIFSLWCVSNWCITTLVDGEGGIVDIFIASAYALTPYILIQIPLVVLSNVIVLEEGAFYILFDAVSVAWSAGLLLCGIMTIHQFSMLKTIGTILIALVGMVIIIFLFVLLFALAQQIINFLLLFFKELAARNNW